MSDYPYYPDAPGKKFEGENWNDVLNQYNALKDSWGTPSPYSEWPVPVYTPGYYDDIGAGIRYIFQAFAIGGRVHHHWIRWIERGEQTVASSFEEMLYRISWDNPFTYVGPIPLYYSSSHDEDVLDVRYCTTYGQPDFHYNFSFTLPVPPPWDDVLTTGGGFKHWLERVTLEATTEYDAVYNFSTLTLRWSQAYIRRKIAYFETAIPPSNNINAHTIPLVVGFGLLNLLLQGNSPTPAKPRKKTYESSIT